MKKALLFIAVCTLGAVALSSCSQKTPGTKQPAGISSAEVDSVSYFIGYSYGMSMKMANFGELNYAKLKKGIEDAFSEKVEINQQQFYNVVNGFMEKRTMAISKDNLAKAEKFFAENGKKEGVVTTETGLQYQIVKAGNDVKAKAEDTVEVNYEGTTLDGVVFDSSYERGQAAKFPLNRVIPGWTEGMQLVGEGGEIILWIPANLAYGEQSPQGSKIGPNEALKFRVEVIAVTPAATEEKAE